MSVRYDAAGVPVRRTYQRMQAPWETFWQDSVVENHRGQWVRHTSTTGERTYGYDRYARLVAVDDTLAAGAACTSGEPAGVDVRGERDRVVLRRVRSDDGDADG